jgi:hypothetical protein
MMAFGRSNPDVARGLCHPPTFRTHLIRRCGVGNLASGGWCLAAARKPADWRLRRLGGGSTAEVFANSQG